MGDTDSRNETTTPDANPSAHTGTRQMLAFERTGLAQERTLMAWVRTAATMISFGFTVYLFFRDLPREATPKFFGPRELALTLTTVGTMTLLLAMWQNHQARTEIRESGEELPFSIASIVGVIIALLGALTFGVVFSYG